MSRLFDPIEPFDQGMLTVSPLHRIYFEQCGNANGLPILFLHGGPGAGSEPFHRRFFDPKSYRIIIFDQRGSGRSTPLASLVDNTTWHLIDDIERLREHLGIERWLVFGGSWGSTLGLAYSETHTERVTGLILRGIFLARPNEIKWFYEAGTNFIYPDAWEGFFEYIPKEEREDLLSAYYLRLTGDDEALRIEAAVAWSVWEASTAKLLRSEKYIKEASEPEKALPIARIECHYFVNNSFFPTDNFLIENISRIRHIPAVIVQGRYDAICPVQSAWELSRAWPEVKLEIIPDAGHSATEQGITEALIRATERFKEL